MHLNRHYVTGIILLPTLSKSSIIFFVILHTGHEVYINSYMRHQVHLYVLNTNSSMSTTTQLLRSSQSTKVEASGLLY